MNKLYILSAMLLATSAQAVTTVFTDDFTGADGTAITNGGTWGYVDLGWENNIDWTSAPRTAPADIFEIRGNELYAEITPLETDVTNVYNKVKASIYPMSGGSQISATIASGEKAVFKVDLTDYVNNPGHMWGLNQELKVVLTQSPDTFEDPNADPNSHLKITIHQSDALNQFTVRGTDNRISGTKVETDGISFTNNAALPIQLTIEHYSSGTTVYLLNDTLIGTISETAMPTVYPYLWLGKFNGISQWSQGNGDVLTTGSVAIDNVEITIDDGGIAPDAATDFIAIVPVSGTIDLSWTDVATNELGYNLERKVGTNDYTNISVLAANTTNYQDSGLLADGTIYDYRLSAVNGMGSAPVETSAAAMLDTFANWAASYAVLSGSKDNNVDYDNDGASDFREYALNGNPTNDANTGMVEAINDGTTLSYIYAMRTDDGSLTYTLIDTKNLIDGPSTTNNWDSQTSGPSGVSNYDSVTNNYNMLGNPLFIGLTVE